MANYASPYSLHYRQPFLCSTPVQGSFRAPDFQLVPVGSESPQAPSYSVPQPCFIEVRFEHPGIVSLPVGADGPFQLSAEKACDLAGYQKARSILAILTLLTNAYFYDPPEKSLIWICADVADKKVHTQSVACMGGYVTEELSGIVDTFTEGYDRNYPLDKPSEHLYNGRMAKQAITLLSIAKMNEDEARAYLESVRWPLGPVCPHCASSKCGALLGVKDKKGRERKGLYKCYGPGCRKQFTVTVGTVMHSSHLSLQQWMVAFYLMASNKKGVAALELQRVLGIGSYQVAWHLAHRIREAMRQEPLASKLAGIVEVDETYMGGKHSLYKGRGRAVKEPVMCLVERGGRAVVKPISGERFKALVRRNVERSAMIYTDEHKAYAGLRYEFKGHESVNHSSGEYASGDVHSNTAESFFALLKRGHYGVFHQLSVKHLERYCDEFAFRWNHRKVTDGERCISALQRVGGKRLEYKALIREAG